MKPSLKPRRRATAIAALALLGGLILAGAVFLVRHPGAVHVLLGQEDEQPLGNESKDGTMPATLVVAGQPISSGIGAVSLSAPESTASATVVVIWLAFPPQASPKLRAILEQRTDGAWEPLEQAEGNFAAILRHAGELSGTDLRVRVEPAEDGAYAQQDFHVSAEYWS